MGKKCLTPSDALSPFGAPPQDSTHSNQCTSLHFLILVTITPPADELPEGGNCLAHPGFATR